MKQSVKRALDTLEALGFRSEPHPYKKATSVHWHANQPDVRLTVFAGMSDAAASKVIQSAEAVIGLGTGAEDAPQRKPKVNHRAKMQRDADRKQRETTANLAEARRQRELQDRATAAVESRKRELDGLLRGRPGSIRGSDVPPDAMLTLEQVADLTGMTDKAVQRAVESDALEAYMCGGTVKVKGADVRTWLTEARTA